ncbi:addiction module protein [Gryllotalpicola koreensis]|uniref:Addiction module protein n=1 Tax=Gryllotalpicola koreensis TaxID=993086 RepID=A0ABP7ZR83_9MICO
MSTDVTTVLETARALSHEQRAELAHQLLLTLEEDVDDETPAEVDAAWNEVIDRRVAEVVNGTAELIDGEESRARVRTLLAKLHE